MNNNIFKEIDENPIILDFSSVSDLDDIHLLLKSKFGFPDYYGENWDALWDLMRDVFLDDGTYTVEILNFNSMGQELRNECKIMLKIFDRVSAENQSFSYQLFS